MLNLSLTVAGSSQKWENLLHFKDESPILSREIRIKCYVLKVLIIIFSLAGVLIPSSRLSAQQTGDVLTYHNDNYRTGWSQGETVLKPGNVDQNSFGSHGDPIKLDGEVDGQPLVVTNQTIDGHSQKMTVVYVATDNNTVYAIDAETGQFLLTPRNLGPSVEVLQRLNCDNNNDNVGINSTQVIDRGSNTLHVIAYTMIDGKPIYRLHALDLSTLADRSGSPVEVSGTRTESGHVLAFNAAFQRQRPALLLANGNVYAAFGSFCDKQAKESRGWVFGWDAKFLRPLATPELTNDGTNSNTLPCTYLDNFPCYLSAIWMSGFGPATDAQGNMYFITGNTAPGSYDKVHNKGESVVKLDPNLKPLDSFSPTDRRVLDVKDKDFGSGGVLVLPDSTVKNEHIALAAGKDGKLYIIDREVMTKDAAHVDIGACFCGPSFFVGEDGVARVVTSGGNKLQIWTIDNTQGFELHAGAAAQIAPSYPPGFFTTISSNGLQKNTAIIWALSRPVEDDKHLVLYAFDAIHDASGKLEMLYSTNAGSWQSKKAGHPYHGAANLVPTVSNGLVFVASDGELRIFGPKKKLEMDSVAALIRKNRGLAEEVSMYWGTVMEIKDNTILLRLRSGSTLSVDLTRAIAAQNAGLCEVGDPVRVSGVMRQNGTLDAMDFSRAPARSEWGPDLK